MPPSFYAGWRETLVRVSTVVFDDLQDVRLANEWDNSTHCRFQLADQLLVPIVGTGQVVRQTLDMGFTTLFLDDLTVGEIGMLPKLICSQFASNESTELVAVTYHPRFRKGFFTIDEGYTPSGYGPVDPTAVDGVMTLAINEKLIGLVHVVVSHPSFRTFFEVMVDIDKADARHIVDRQYDGFGRVDGAERHIGDTRTLLEAQSEGFEVGMSDDESKAAQLIVRTFNFGVGSCGLEKRTEIHCSTSLPHSGILCWKHSNIGEQEHPEPTHIIHKNIYLSISYLN